MLKHRDLFIDIVPTFGAFHTISCLLSVIGKQFSPAGLRSVTIESGVSISRWSIKWESL